MLKRILVGFFILISSISVAQEGTTSPYSFYGIGSLNFRGTAENRTMGGISVHSDSIHLNLQNPAGLSELRLVNYSISASHERDTEKTDNETQKLQTTSFDYLAIGIPIAKGVGASFGVLPYTSVGYSILDEGDDSTTQYNGEGGLNRVFLALGTKIFKGFSIGVDADYNFGRIENTSVTTIADIERGTQETNRSNVSGLSLNFGAQYRTMVSENLEFSGSITYTPETNFTSENSRTIGTIFVSNTGNIPIDSRDVDVEDSEFTFPSQFTVGLGIGKPKKWFVGAEYTDQKTSNFSNQTFEIENVTFNDAAKYRLGGFYIPNYNAIGNYWKRVVYRAGVRFEESGLNINGEDINEFGISFGVGVPVGRIFSNINLGLEVGRRGTKNAGLVQENFFNAFLSLSLNDRWFEKRYYD
ncbi:hypothetical protein [Patiriisocius hiemis]|uniref:Long-chain fatty acid transport protein n=1 Tax=Patiriisocius hiemis TaxID=3075604 RepID=A0ABU2YF34_9FLAO|nr:hypothetical protein [Constantimarinum sp. W242]MDT0556274.1 hypothetical protein [Constantimarinum sp. W242]